MTHTCPCGCALAAWSMPWPMEVAPWSPAVVHERAPVASRQPVPSLFPVGAVDPELVDEHLVDADLAEAHLVEVDPTADPVPFPADPALSDTELERPRRAS